MPNKIIILIILLVSSLCLQGQSRMNRSKRYVLWFTPSGASSIYGLAVGIMADPEFTDDDHQEIYGINCEVGPWGAFAFLFVPLTTMFAPFSSETDPSQFLWSGNAYLEYEKPEIFIRGLNLSLGGHGGPTQITGISLNGVFTSTIISEGFSAALLMNVTYSFNGVMLSLRNKATTGKGLMFGMLNNCDDCTGVQIGFLNRMGRRVLPLINWRRKSKRYDFRKRT